MSLEKFNAIVADPDIQTRMRLKQATSAVPQFGEVAQANSLKEVLTKLASGRWDVVFVSQRFGEDEIKSLVVQAKETKGGQDSAYVLVLKSAGQEKSSMGAQMLSGADGFLFEPYSVDQLVEITHLSARVRKEREETRQKIGYTLLITDFMTQLDTCAYLRSLDYELSRSLEKLREMAHQLHIIPENKRDALFEVMIKLFSEAAPPKAMFQGKQYSGASERVKKKLADKIVMEAEKLRAQNALAAQVPQIPPKK